MKSLIMNGENYSIGKLLAAIYEEMEANNGDEITAWKNLKLIRDAYEIIRSYPENIEGCYSNETEKALFLHKLLCLTWECDCPALSVEIRSYIKDTLPAADDETFAGLEETWTLNNRMLTKRKQYLDESLTMEEYCKINGVGDWFDPFLRTGKWEDMAYDVYKEVYDNLGNPEQYGANYYGMSLLEQKEVMLKKYDIEWKDVTDMNPQKRYRHLSFEIDGNEITTDRRELYHVYHSVVSMTEKNPDTFGNELEKACRHISLWFNETERELNAGEISRAKEFVNAFEKASKMYITDPEDLDTPLDILLSYIPDIDEFEYNHRFSPVHTAGCNEETEAGRLRNFTLNTLAGVIDIHRKHESNFIHECNAMEQTVLDDMKTLIETHGHHDLHIYRSALMACNNWHTFKLMRGASFSCDLLDGINHYGSLSPDRAIDWAVLQKLAGSNPDMYFIEDMERLYDIVCNAIEKGDDDIPYMATVVRNIIWEPENPIDED